MENRINYVIASYAGVKGAVCRDTLCNVDPHPKDYIRVHLEQLVAISHHLAQITLCKAATGDGDAVYDNYYDIPDSIRAGLKCPLVELNVPNEGISYGQYIRAFKKQSDFDYYIFVEDDYIPSLNDFDQRLVQMYQRLYKVRTKNVGVLCQWASKNGTRHVHGAHGLFIMSGKTMDLMCRTNKTCLDQLRVCAMGKCQVLFGVFFNNASITTKDLTGVYHTPYFHGAGKEIINCSARPNTNTALFVPIQMYRNYVNFDYASIAKHPFVLKEMEQERLNQKMENRRRKYLKAISHRRY